MTTKPQHKQDYIKVKGHLEALGKSQEDCCDPCHYRGVDPESLNSLSRLRDEAAKVPGLMADNARIARERDNSEAQERADWNACCEVLGWECSLPKDLPAPSRALRVVLDRLRKAEKTVADYNLATEWHACCPDMALRTQQLHAAESERDALERDMNAEMDGKLALRAKLGAKDNETYPEFVRRLASERDAETARADTAEARVKGLEAAIRAKADDYRTSHGEDEEGPHPMVDWAERVLRGASQPPPAPAQGVDMEVAEYITREHEAAREACSLAGRQRHRGRVEGASAALRIVERTPSQPALVEAVGPRITPVERLVDVARRIASGAHNRMVFDDLDAALAAYDAAKGVGR